VAIGSMTFLLFITFDLPPASFLRAISIPMWPRLNGKRFSELVVVLKPWRCHIQGLFVSQLNTFCFAIYVILDAFSRYVVDWMVAEGESEDLAGKLIAETCDKQGIEPGSMTLHADCGSSMKRN
jgi:transposase InsO family protein